MFHEAEANTWLVKGIVCVPWREASAPLLTECADSIKAGAYVALPCGLCHGATTLSARFTCEAKCLIRDKRVTVCVMQGGKVIPALHV